MRLATVIETVLREENLATDTSGYGYGEEGSGWYESCSPFSSDEYVALAKHIAHAIYAWEDTQANGP